MLRTVPFLNFSASPWKTSPGSGVGLGRRTVALVSDNLPPGLEWNAVGAVWRNGVGGMGDAGRRELHRTVWQDWGWVGLLGGQVESSGSPGALDHSY